MVKKVVWHTVGSAIGSGVYTSIVKFVFLLNIDMLNSSSYLI